jgi:hypothetical protein
MKRLSNMSKEELIELLQGDSSASPNDKIVYNKPIWASPDLLAPMTQDNILHLLHHPNSSPPPVCPRDTPNPSDTNPHWTAEELYWATGYCCFRSYRHLIAVTSDGKYIDGDGFPSSIGAYATIPKAPRGKPIVQTPSKYLDVVHLDIAFGD